MAVIFDESVVSPVLVGRAEYVDALGRIVEQAGDGRGHVVLITGEAGVGKSRLLAEVKARAVAEGWLALQGQCFEPDRTIPFAPLLEVLRDHLATLAPAELRRALGAAAPAITRLLPEIAGRLPDLSSLPPLEPEQQQHLFFAALAQHFQHLAAQRPLLLILEDLHWSDENSLEALLFLARRITTQRLLLWLSVRSDEATPALTRFVAELERRHVATEIELPRLSAEQVSQLVQAILHTEQPAGRDFVKDVYDLTNGNPFFVEEILKSLIAGGDIADTGEDWAGKPIGKLRMPRSLRAAVLQRTEKLSEAAKDVLASAAVVGQRFDFVVLQCVTLYGEGELLQLIKELIAAQLVHEVTAEYRSSDHFAFRHALTRQVVYGELLARERRLRHGAIAAALEALYASPAAREAHLAELAYHFYAAGAWAKAWEYERGAGERALALYAPGAAIEHLSHARESAAQLQVQPPGQVYYSRGQAYETRGEFERARADYESAVAAARLAADGTMECGIASWHSVFCGPHAIMLAPVRGTSRPASRRSLWPTQSCGRAASIAWPIGW